MTLEHWLHGDLEDGEEEIFLCRRLYRTNWQTIRRRNIKSAARKIAPHSRYRPQKLIKWSWLGSTSRPFSPEQPLLQNHLLRISWSFPLSESFKIAVDMSTARGDSLLKAWDSRNKQNLLRKCHKQNHLTLIDLDQISSNKSTCLKAWDSEQHKIRKITQYDHYYSGFFITEKHLKKSYAWIFKRLFLIWNVFVLIVRLQSWWINDIRRFQVILKRYLQIPIRTW